MFVITAEDFSGLPVELQAKISMKQASHSPGQILGMAVDAVVGRFAGSIKQSITKQLTDSESRVAQAIAHQGAATSEIEKRIGVELKGLENRLGVKVESIESPAQAMASVHASLEETKRWMADQIASLRTSVESINGQDIAQALLGSIENLERRLVESLSALPANAATATDLGVSESRILEAIKGIGGAAADETIAAVAVAKVSPTELSDEGNSASAESPAPVGESVALKVTTESATPPDAPPRASKKRARQAETGAEADPGISSQKPTSPALAAPTAPVETAPVDAEGGQPEPVELQETAFLIATVPGFPPQFYPLTEETALEVVTRLDGTTRGYLRAMCDVGDYATRYDVQLLYGPEEIPWLDFIRSVTLALRDVTQDPGAAFIQIVPAERAEDCRLAISRPVQDAFLAALSSAPPPTSGAGSKRARKIRAARGANEGAGQPGTEPDPEPEPSRLAHGAQPDSSPDHLQALKASSDELEGDDEPESTSFVEDEPFVHSGDPSPPAEAQRAALAQADGDGAQHYSPTSFADQDSDGSAPTLAPIEEVVRRRPGRPEGSKDKNPRKKKSQSEGMDGVTGADPNSASDPGRQKTTTLPLVGEIPARTISTPLATAPLPEHSTVADETVAPREAPPPTSAPAKSQPQPEPAWLQRNTDTKSLLIDTLPEGDELPDLRDLERLSYGGWEVERTDPRDFANLPLREWDE